MDECTAKRGTGYERLARLLAQTVRCRFLAAQHAAATRGRTSRLSDALHCSCERRQRVRCRPGRTRLDSTRSGSRHIAATCTGQQGDAEIELTVAVARSSLDRARIARSWTWAVDRARVARCACLCEQTGPAEIWRPTCRAGEAGSSRNGARKRGQTARRCCRAPTP